MCTLCAQTSNLATIRQRFGVTASSLPNLPSRPEIYPGWEAAIVRAADGGREVATALWGFPPPSGRGELVANVRNLESPYWRPWLKRAEQRCLVPVDAFAEWSAEPDPATGRKRRVWFSLADEAERPFALAGVWRPGLEDEIQSRMAFLTTMPNRVVAQIHHKSMPVILHRADYDRWLNGSIAEATALARAFPDKGIAILT